MSIAENNISQMGRRRNKVAVCQYNLDDPAHEDGLPPESIAWSFVDGRELTASLSEFTPEILKIAALRGITEAVRDTYAGHGDNIDKAYEAGFSRLATMKNGDWGKQREPGEGGSFLWIEAMARLKGWFLADGKPDVAKSRARVREIEATPTGSDTLDAIKKSDAVKAEVQKIRADRAREAAERAQAEMDARRARGETIPDALAAF